jgi:hypothetical protein
MSDDISFLLGAGGSSWNLPSGEEKRQAIASLRGYAYQLHQSLAAWIRLPKNASLHLEIAEDYATVAADPAALDAVLTATQVKDTRESGSVTLNSSDVLDAIRHFWALREANPGRPIRFEFLTTSPIGQERRRPLAGGTPGLEQWRAVARGADPTQLRCALLERFAGEPLAHFLGQADDRALRRELIAPVGWSCGAPPISEIETDNRAALVELGQEVGGTPDLSARAADILLARILAEVLAGRQRRLVRGDLLTALHEAVTLRVPAQAAMGALGAAFETRSARLNLNVTGAWRPSAAPTGRVAPRTAGLAAAHAALGPGGVVWLHGATGLGKTMLAELIANDLGGEWRLLDLRGAFAATVAERLVAVRTAIVVTPGLAGIILDDLQGAHEQQIEEPLAQLAAAMRRLDCLCVVTSHDPPPRRVARALALSDGATQIVPSFDHNDAADLVAAYGGAPATWTQFVWFVGGAGHPQLVDVVVAGLAQRGWPESAMREWVQAGLRNDDVEAEREAARRRLLEELDRDRLQLLARTVRIMGGFDRELALAAGRHAPPIASPGLALDRLIGHWIERSEGGRFRASPLVQGLDRQMMSADELCELDRAIALGVLTRPSVEADLVDVAFVHVTLARDEGILMEIIQQVLAAEMDQRAMLASAMPMFREADALAGGMLADWPLSALLLRLAQHRLVAAVADPAKLAASAAALLVQLDALPDLGSEASPEAMVLSSMLVDNFAFGKLPDWFDLLLRLERSVRASGPLSGIAERAAQTTGYDPIDFAFLAHATHLPNLAALATLFDQLDALEPADRNRWLASLHTDPYWLSMLIDNAWLKQSQVETMAGYTQSTIFHYLGEMALRWGDRRLAGKAFRAEAIMLDEYAHEPEASLDALTKTQEILPENFDLARERAKIAWRAADYATALSELSALADRMGETEPLDAAFALREAAVSAGELQDWHRSYEFFERARYFVLLSRDGEPSTFATGLAVDAAAARFAAGNRAGAVRAMVPALEEVLALNPEADLPSRAAHLVARHVALWMQASTEDKLDIDGEEIRYAVGSASNLAPNKLIAARPVVGREAAWLMLGRLGLQLGIPSDEVLSWPGVASIQEYPALDVMFRMALMNAAIDKESLYNFTRYVLPNAEGLHLMTTGRWRENPPDPLDPPKGEVPALPSTELQTPLVRGFLRDATLAHALSSVLRRPGTNYDLAPLHQAIMTLAGYDPLPEWGGEPPTDPDATETAALILKDLAAGGPVSLETLFMRHLRLLEWIAISNHKPVLLRVLAARVREDWAEAVEHRSAFMVRPRVTIPAICEAIAMQRKDEAYIAGILLTAEAAVSLNLAPEFRDRLRASLL